MFPGLSRNGPLQERHRVRYGVTVGLENGALKTAFVEANASEKIHQRGKKRKKKKTSATMYPRGVLNKV